jgi:hypothetical protein
MQVLCAACAAQVVINEVLADPARDWDGDGQYDYRNDEWIEIVNRSEGAVDLATYLVADGGGEPVWRYGFAGTLAPGGVMVVFGSESRAWEEANGFPVYGLSLNNTGDIVSLYRISGGETLLVDTCVFDDRVAEDDRSIGRPLNDQTAWEVFDALNPCADRCDPAGNGCIPTPGSPNDCLTATERRSWGSIKKEYR